MRAGLQEAQSTLLGQTTVYQDQARWRAGLQGAGQGCRLHFTHTRPVVREWQRSHPIGQPHGGALCLVGPHAYCA